MPRVTDTRQRVHELADSLVLQGKKPSVTLIRAMLGKGSPNTVVSALRDWEERRRSAADGPTVDRGSAVRASSGPGAQPVEVTVVLEHVELLVRAQEGARVQIQQLSAMHEKAVAMMQAMNGLQETLQSTTKALLDDKAWAKEQLEVMQLRFDTVQRHMLLRIEEARADAARHREEAKHHKQELQTWRISMQDKTAALQREVHRLEGELAAYRSLRGGAASSQFPRGNSSLPRGAEEFSEPE